MKDYYNTATGFGAYVGRNVNRISGASVTIEGGQYLLDTNDGENNLPAGTTDHIVNYIVRNVEKMKKEAL